MGRLVPLLALAVALAPLAAAGCGTDAVGVAACKQIEEARCLRAAKSCPQLQVSPPVYNSGSWADACIRDYDVACLHGLSVSDPGPAVVNACVSAIQSGTCDVVQNPTTAAACAWLQPPASTAADASDAEGGEGGEGGDAGDGAEAGDGAATGD